MTTLPAGMLDVQGLRRRRRQVEQAAAAMAPRYHYYNETLNDRWVVEYALPGREGGVFVEAGASNGRDGSSCHVLEKELGWSGLCIEPNADFYAELLTHRPGSICENVCLSDQAGTVVFSHPDGYGPASPYLGGIRRNLERYKSGSEDLLRDCRDEALEAVPLHALLDRHQLPAIIDYAGFDIEGSEYAVISQFPFHRYTFLCLSFEAEYWVSLELHKVLEANRYHAVGNPFTDKCWEYYYLHESIL